MDTSFEDRICDLFDPHAETERTPSAKAIRRQQRKQAKMEKQHQRHAAKPLEPLNETQADYMESLKEADQIFAVGAAGTGKTYIASRHATKRLVRGEVSQVLIARPTVCRTKHKQGFLPGTLEEKLAPWLIPILQAIKEEVGKARLEQLRNEDKIEIISFEHIRGRTFNDAVVILDEAQNCDILDLRTFLTRIGKGTQVIISGDPDQVDIPASGLSRILHMVETHDIDADIIEFDSGDVVRSEIAKAWVQAFENEPI